MRFQVATLIILIISAFCSFSFAQDETVSIETNLVSLNVAVTDKNGDFVRNLRKEQFEVFDGGEKQQIAHFSVEEAPVTYGIVYDMHPTTAERTEAVLDSLRVFTKELRREDNFFIVFFDHRGSLKLDFVPTVEQLARHLPDRREPNSLYDAIYLATDKIRESPNLKRTLIIVSDSADHRSRHNFSDLNENLKKLDAQIYAVIFDEASNLLYRDVTRNGKNRRASLDATALERRAIRDLSIKSGGSVYSPISENSLRLAEIYGEIAAETRRQYTISFYPAEPDGKWHDLRVNLRDAEGSRKFALTYRRGYFSPPPKTRK